MSPIYNPNQSSSPMRAIDQARSHATGADTAWRKAVVTVRHLDLFGPMVVEAVMRDIEGVHEHGSEAAHHYEEALRVEQDRATTIGRNYEAMHDSIQAFRPTVVAVLEDVERRYAKAHKRLPEYVADLRLFLAATDESEPF